jgi:hypothetical protein
VIEKLFNEERFRLLCRQAMETTKQRGLKEPLPILREIVYGQAGVLEPTGPAYEPKDIYHLNQILTFVEMRMEPSFAVRRVIMEELYRIKYPAR